MTGRVWVRAGVAVLVGLSVIVVGNPSSAAGCESAAVVTDLGDNGGARQLRTAINEACVGAVITVIPGTIALQPQPPGQPEWLLLQRDVTITGLGPEAKPTVIDAHGQSRVIGVDRAHVILANLTITGGNATGPTDTDKSGGGIASSGRVDLFAVRVTGNFAAFNGGGIASAGVIPGSAAVLTLNLGSVVSNNSAPQGAGIASDGVSAPASLTLNDWSSVTNNSTSAFASDNVAGGISNVGIGGEAVVTMNGASSVTANRSGGGGGINSTTIGAPTRVIMNDHSTVSGNVSVSGSGGGGGGGIFNATFGVGGTATVVVTGQATIEQNQADTGAGVFNWGGGGPGAVALTLTDSATIRGNTAAIVGGGVFNLSGPASVSVTLTGASSITGNTATFVGGGIFSSGFVTIMAAVGAISGNLPAGDQCFPAAPC